MNTSVIRNKIDLAKVLDFSFKILELFLAARLVIYLFGFDINGRLFAPLAFITNIFYLPLSTLLPTYEFGVNSTYALESATLTALLVVIILDVITSVVIEKYRISPAEKSQITINRENTNELAEPVVPPNAHEVIHQDMSEHLGINPSESVFPPPNQDTVKEINKQESKY